jgi:hypothetical protein
LKDLHRDEEEIRAEQLEREKEASAKFYVGPDGVQFDPVKKFGSIDPHD